MSSIYILTVSTYDQEFLGDWYFSELDKSIDFIRRNFSSDDPKSITGYLWEGARQQYLIEERMINQTQI